jgi:hypothetical protein
MREELSGSTRHDAFHITAAENLGPISSEGFRVDQRGVLGCGAYFDLGTEATGWAPARRRYPGQPLVVLRCVIRLGRVLDLDDPEVRSLLRDFQRGLVQRVGRDQALALGQGGHIDLLLRLLLEAGETYHSVKRTFATDGQTRVAVRESMRVRVLACWSEEGDERPWPPSED